MKHSSKGDVNTKRQQHSYQQEHFTEMFLTGTR